MDQDTLRTLLLLLLIVPSVCAVAAWVMGEQRGEAIRWLSLTAAVAMLVLACIIAANFVTLRAAQTEMPATARGPTFLPEFVPGATPADPHRTTWNMVSLGSAGAVQFFIGVDGINVWLLVLTTVLLLAGVLVSWTAVEERVNEYYGWLLAIGTAMLGVFLAFDIILFYIFFELTLVPLFFLIGIWGGPERRHAARKFFIYTLAGSLITMLGVLALVLVCYDRAAELPARDQVRQLTFAIPDLVRLVNDHLAASANAPASADFWQNFQVWVFLALITGFAIKVPLVPLHTWLPLAHVEAPTAGSVLLAGVLLKVGTYGFLRLCLPLTPDASIAVGVPLIGTLAVIGIIYGALCALAQDDIKKLVAYSSVSHLGFCMLGMFALNLAGLTGSLLQMINHGLSTGALFLLVGMLYERYHTRKMADYGGMGARLGLLAACFVFITLSSIGLPFLNGFVGEALVFLGMYDVRPVLAVIGTSGIVLGAWYMLTLVRNVFFGPVKEPVHEGHGLVGDLNFREVVTLLPIVGLCILLGVYPQPAIDAARPDLKVVADILAERGRAQRALAARTPPGPAHDALAVNVGEKNDGE
jgi:NADH-quinone oxidoreductase subunit M